MSLAAGSDDKAVHVYNVQSGKQTQNLTGHAGPVEAVVFSADGVLIAAGSREETAILPHGEVRLWHAASGQL
jgi:WD40 repeat protein